MFRVLKVVTRPLRSSYIHSIPCVSVVRAFSNKMPRKPKKKKHKNLTPAQIDKDAKAAALKKNASLIDTLEGNETSPTPYTPKKEDDPHGSAKARDKAEAEREVIEEMNKTPDIIILIWDYDHMIEDAIKSEDVDNYKMAYVRLFAAGKKLTAFSERDFILFRNLVFDRHVLKREINDVEEYFDAWKDDRMKKLTTEEYEERKKSEIKIINNEIYENVNFKKVNSSKLAQLHSLLNKPLLPDTRDDVANEYFHVFNSIFFNNKLNVDIVRFVDREDFELSGKKNAPSTIYMDVSDKAMFLAIFFLDEIVIKHKSLLLSLLHEMCRVWHYSTYKPLFKSKKLDNNSVDVDNDPDGFSRKHTDAEIYVEYKMDQIEEYFKKLNSPLAKLLHARKKVQKSRSIKEAEIMETQQQAEEEDPKYADMTRVVELLTTELSKAELNQWLSAPKSTLKGELKYAGLSKERIQNILQKLEEI